MSEDGGDFAPASDIFTEQLPYYMAIGMTPEDYWDGDCDLPIYYRKAHALRNQQRNQELWIQGRYFYDALKALAPILVAFPKKNAKPDKYLEEPYPLTQEEAAERKARREAGKKADFITKMNAWAAKANALKKEADTDG